MRHLRFHAAVTGRSTILTDTQYLFNFLYILRLKCESNSSCGMYIISDFVETICPDDWIL